MEEKELFEDYEMRSWEFSPRIYKILGIATLTNLLFLAAFGQFNLLTTRGCDTPYAGIVCQVLDSAYVASTFLGRDSDWESRPYTKEEIADADITYIDVSDKLEYPEGYFALANPESSLENPTPTDELAGLPNSNSPLTPLPSSNSDLSITPQVTPTPNKSLEDQEDVKSPFEIAGNNPTPSYKPPRIKTPKPSKNSIMSNESPGSLGGPKATPTPKPQPTPSPTPDSEIAKNEFTQKFNNQPLKDYADTILAKTNPEDPKQMKVDLKQAFTVVMDGVLTKEGRLDMNKSRFVKGEGSQEMQDVAKGAIEAVNNSGLFVYLKDLGAEKVNFTLIQDDKQIYAIIRSDQPTPEKAKSISSGLGVLISVAQGNVKEPEVQTLMKAAKITAQGKSFILNFALPKDEAHKIIDQKLQEARQKKSQPNSGDGMKESATAKGK